MGETKVEELAAGIATDEADLKAATEIRGKEASDFAGEDQDLSETIDMLQRASAILEREMQGGASMLRMRTKMQEHLLVPCIRVRVAELLTQSKTSWRRPRTSWPTFAKLRSRTRTTSPSWSSPSRTRSSSPTRISTRPRKALLRAQRRSPLQTAILL